MNSRRRMFPPRDYLLSNLSLALCDRAVTKNTHVNVRFGSSADMCSALGHVRFVPIADISHVSSMSPVALDRAVTTSSSVSAFAQFYEWRGAVAWPIERRTQHVALVTMNTNKANAQNPTFFEDLHRALDQLEAEFNDCAVVLTGTGRVFSAGLDFDYHFPLFARR